MAHSKPTDSFRGVLAASFLLVIAAAVSGVRGYGQCTLSSPSQWNVTSGNWSAAGNWTPSGVPNSSTTNVCLTNGTNGTPATTMLDISTTVGDLQLGSFNALNIPTGQSFTVAGSSILNAGAINLNGGGGANSFLLIGSNATLSGGGKLTLANTVSGGGNAFIEQNVGGLTLTNADNTIQGNGIVGNNGLSLVNQSSGVIDATTSAGLVPTLTLNSTGSVTNQGLMEATSGTLVLQNSGGINNTGGNITANKGTVDVNTTITGGTLNTVSGGTLQTFNGSATLDGVTISGGSTYTASNNATTHLQGAITNNGTVLLNGGGGANGLLNIDNNVTLTGGGTLNLATTASGGGNAIIQQNVSGLTLTNANNTIQGNGIIGSNGLALVNQPGGVIDATTASGQIGSLTLNGGGAITNQGLMEATTGTLVIQNAVTNTGGNITASAGTVDVNTTITGGTLNTAGGGTMQTFNGSATLDGVTISSGSTYTASNNATTHLQGAITNNGTILLNGGGGANGLLNIDNNVTLTGGGTLTLATTTSGGGNAIIQQDVSGLTLTNADNTIQGNGIIGSNGLAVSNAATISANVSGATLLLNGGGTVTNTGQLDAAGGGILQIENPVANAGGTIIAGAGSTVQLLNGSSVTAGTLTNSGGTLETATGNSTTLDGSTVAGAVTINGTYTASDNATTVLLGTITNAGAIQLNGGNGANGLLNLGSGAALNLTLQGGGTLALATTALNGGNAIIQQSVGGVTLTNVDNTIAGNGIIGSNGLALVNESGGVIDATTASGQIGSLTLNGGGAITNQGLMEATTGTLVIQNAVTNTGGNITASAGTVDVNTTITGGTLNTAGGGTMQTFNGSATLDGVTISSGSTYTASDNATTHLQGTITNNGTILLNGGGGANGLLNIDNNVTLTGGGTLNLATTASGGGNAIIQQNVSGLTLTNANNTIQGNGIIGSNGLALVNQPGGVIDATTASGQIGSLTLNGGGAITNQGLMEATTGTLVIQNAVTNTGGDITASAGTVDVNTTITGGTLNTAGGGTMQTFNGSATLNGVTISSGSTYTASNNATTHLQGAITNNGTILLNGGGGANGLLSIDNNVTLTGGGTLTLTTAGGGGNAIIQQNVSGLTLTNADNTIQGNGIIGSNGLALVNDSGGKIDANVSGATLVLNGGGPVTNNGGFVAFPGSVLHVTGGSTLTNFSAGTLTGGTYRAIGTIQIDSLGSTGGEIVTNNANIILDGLGGGAALISDSAGKNALSNLATNQGSLFLLDGGNANFTTAGNLANSGTVTVGSGTTLALGSIGASSLNQSAGLTQGNGTIAGKVAINGGKLLPGEAGAPGTLTINGTTSLNGTFAEQIGSASNFSVLNVGVGNLTLGSASLLNISLLGSFNPVGDTFTIMNATGGVSGAFSNAPASGFAMDGINWTIAYNSNDVVLNGVSLVGSLVTATWNTPSSNWTTPTEWACTPGPANCVPNNSSSNTYAAVINSPGNTLTLDSTSSPSSVTVQTLSLQAGTLDIGSGATLNLANQPDGITDIPNGAGITLEAGSHFAAGSNGGLYKLTSIEGSLTVDNGLSGAAETVTPTTGTLTVSSTGVVNISGAGTAPTVDGNLANSGTVNVSSGGTLDLTGNVTNSGSITDGTAITIGGKVSNTGTVTVSSGGTISAAQYDNLAGTTHVESGGVLNTTATSGFTYDQAGGLTQVDGALTTYQYDATGGTTQIDTGGTLTTTNAYDQSGATTLTDIHGAVTTSVYDNAGGTTHVESGGALHTTGASGNTYDQAGGLTQVDGTLTTYQYDATGGKTLVTSGGKINTTFQYDQSGSSTTTFVNAGGVISVGSAYVQNGGKTTVDGKLLVPAVQLNGGTLTGTGVVQGSVSNTGGMLMPGDAPGTGAFTITGNYMQGAAGSFMTDIASGLGFDALSVGGTASLDGTLDINLPNGFGFLTNGEQFVILDAAGGLSGTFATVNGLSFGTGDSWLVAYGANAVTLTAQIPTMPPAPEPGEILLLGIGLLALGWALQRRNRVASVG